MSILSIFKSRERKQLDEMLYVQEYQLKTTLIRLAYIEKFDKAQLDARKEGDYRDELATEKKRDKKADLSKIEDLNYKISECAATRKIHRQLTAEIVEYNRMVRLIKKQISGELNLTDPSREDYFRNVAAKDQSGENDPVDKTANK